MPQPVAARSTGRTSPARRSAWDRASSSGSLVLAHLPDPQDP
ncbi:hypothetical protein [Actinoallomurus sp. CA-150999]